MDRSEIETWPPSRIEAICLNIDHKAPGPPDPPNVGHEFHLWGRNLEYDPQATDVHLFQANAYGVLYPRMDLHSLFPALGKLYCFDRKIDRYGRARFSASRLNDDEMPSGVTLGKDAFIFPLLAHRPSSQWTSGGVTESLQIVVGAIEQNGQGEESQLTARILAGNIHDDNFQLRLKDDDKSHWQLVYVGDVVTFDPQHRYRVVNIVQPDTKGQMVRGHLCKMIGWIELDAKPLQEPDAEKKAATAKEK